MIQENDIVLRFKENYSGSKIYNVVLRGAEIKMGTLGIRKIERYPFRYSIKCTLLTRDDSSIRHSSFLMMGTNKGILSDTRMTYYKQKVKNFLDDKGF